MYIGEYRRLDPDERAAARERAENLADDATYAAAKLHLVEAAEAIREHWPDAVAAVIEDCPPEGWIRVHTVQADGQRLLWEVRDDPQGWADVGHDIAQMVDMAFRLHDGVLTEVETEVETGFYALWLVDWLEPEVDLG